jgi:hypothetical protein
MFYVLVNSAGITVHKAEKIPSIKQMQSLVGIPGKPAFFEVASYTSFSEPGITIFCDDDFPRKNFEPTLITKEGDTIHGQCLILGTNRQAENNCLLNQRQVDLIKREIRLVTPQK